MHVPSVLSIARTASSKLADFILGELLSVHQRTIRFHLGDLSALEHEELPDRLACELALDVDAALAEKRLHLRNCGVLRDPRGAGAGKSTHLRRMALWLSRRSGETLGLPIDAVPIVLPLQERSVTSETFREAVLAHLRADSRLEPSFIESLLARKHLVFLVDGLDEIPDEDTLAGVMRWIEEGLRGHPHARVMLTRRPLDGAAADRESAGWLEVQLLPLDEPEAKAIVRRWFRAAVRGDAADGEAGRGADALWAELRAPEFRTPRMFELTRNPMMLTAICVLQSTRGELPRRRIELYEQCVQVLLHRFRGVEGLPRRFGDREARHVLQPLAHWLHDEHGRIHADATAIAAGIEPHLAAALGVEPRELDGAAIVRAMGTAGAILTPMGSNGYGLVHLGFQEYLCARHLRTLSHGDPTVLDRLAERFGDPWWREVTLLLLALGEPALFEPLMRRVVELPSFVEHHDWVSDCIQDAAEASVAPFVELLLRAPGDDPGRWRRQLAAWQVVEKWRPEQLTVVAPGLRTHPFDELRRLADRDDRAEPFTMRSARGAYELVEIPAGRFMMGSHHLERDRKGGEGPRHEVELARFFMGKYPVTNEEYGRYLRECSEAREPAYWGDPRYNQPRQPVVGVSWHEAVAYCEWVGLSLPTEAQWEYACRAGTRTAFWSGREDEDLARVGWYADNSGQRLHAVGEKLPNPFGLHDTHGNVWEWCRDGFGEYKGNPPRPGDGLRHPPQDGGNRMIRGGSWINDMRSARSAYRLNRHPDNRLSYLGFRAVELVEPDDG